jgi:PIN domain nuclease of toxin-antitoxin system
MERKESHMIYLDTHVVVWLYEGLLDKFSKNAIQLIEANDLVIAPIVQLELTYLHEIKKINRSSHVITNELQSRLGLKVCDLPYDEVVDKAISLNWTRDPFDRLLVAQAMCNSSKLLTKDKTIRKYAKLAVWD